MKVKFVCRESKARKNGQSPIEMSVIINGERSIITLDRCCFASKFNAQSQKVRGDKELNEYLCVTRNHCLKIQSQMLEKGMAFNLQSFLHCYKNGIDNQVITIEKVFDEVIDGYVMKYNAGNCNKSTISRYVTTKQHFIEYVGNIDIQDVTPNSVTRLYDCLSAKMANNTVVQRMKCLKKVLQYAVDEGYTKTSPFKMKMKIDKLEYHPLTSEQINIIKNKEITITRLLRIRDLFLFQCYTGLAYVDMASLKREDIKDGYIQKNRMKTSVKAVIPLLDGAKDILEKYNYELPVLSNQKYNSYLKELGDICGIEQTLTTHLARHTFATICINNMIDINVIAKMMGHSSTRITLSTYAHMQNNTVLQQRDILNKIF